MQEPKAPLIITQQQGSMAAPGFAPLGFPMRGAANSRFVGVTVTWSLITAQDMNFLTTPISWNDPPAQALEALHVSQLNTQLHPQRRTLEAAEREARWQETKT